MYRFMTFAAAAALGLFALGCGQPAPRKAAPAAGSSNTPAKPVAGEHPAHGAGPHGGTLTDWGGGAYHVEFTVDHDKKEATVYIVGSDEKSPSPIKAKAVAFCAAGVAAAPASAASIVRRDVVCMPGIVSQRPVDIIGRCPSKIPRRRG